MENERYNKINELIELHEFLSVIARDKKGNPIKESGYFEENPDKAKLYKKELENDWKVNFSIKEFDKFYKTRLAENENDFEEIYKRELAELNKTDENKPNFIKDVKEYVNDLITTYKKNYIYVKRDKNLLSVASSFISFLDSKLNQNETIMPNIDLSDSDGTEKIIMLYKMGIFDFLKKQEPFNTSKNSLANAISGITGMEEKTVQSYINPIDNPKTVQKNNPLTHTKTVKKVIQKLNSLGYIPIK